MTTPEPASAVSRIRARAKALLDELAGALEEGVPPPPLHSADASEEGGPASRNEADSPHDHLLYLAQRVAERWQRYKDSGLDVERSLGMALDGLQVYLDSPSAPQSDPVLPHDQLLASQEHLQDLAREVLTGLALYRSTAVTQRLQGRGRSSAMEATAEAGAELARSVLAHTWHAEHLPAKRFRLRALELARRAEDFLKIVDTVMPGSSVTIGLSDAFGALRMQAQVVRDTAAADMADEKRLPGGVALSQTSFTEWTPVAPPPAHFCRQHGGRMDMAPRTPLLPLAEGFRPRGCECTLYCPDCGAHYHEQDGQTSLWLDPMVGPHPFTWKGLVRENGDEVCSVCQHTRLAGEHLNKNEPRKLRPGFVPGEDNSPIWVGDGPVPVDPYEAEGSSNEPDVGAENSDKQGEGA